MEWWLIGGLALLTVGAIWSIVKAKKKQSGGCESCNKSCCDSRVAQNEGERKNMKEAIYFYIPSCPHCRKAQKFVSELKEENPKYAGIDFKMVNENKEVELANSYDYYSVPCFFVDGKKVLEGYNTKESVQEVLDLIISEEN